MQISEAASQLEPLVTTLRQAADWPTAVIQVADQIEASDDDEAKALLLAAVCALAVR